MELKQKTCNLELFLRTLLIVPYGIETQQDQQHQRSHLLLIVPYGIETKVCQSINTTD